MSSASTPERRRFMICCDRGASLTNFISIRAATIGDMWRNISRRRCSFTRERSASVPLGSKGRWNTRRAEVGSLRLEVGSGYPTPTFFWKCVKRKGFKSFVLKVCESKGFADVFLSKYVKINGLGGILASFEVSRSLLRSLLQLFAGSWFAGLR